MVGKKASKRAPSPEELAWQETKLRALGAQIRALRKAKDLTQEELAEKCDFDPTYISLLERGERNPPFSTLCKLAERMGRPVRDLVATVE